MHLHSLEAKASEPGLMKRKPGNWLDFNANEREQETEMIQRGREKQQGLFSLSVGRRAKRHGARRPRRGAARPTLMQSELPAGGKLRPRMRLLQPAEGGGARSSEEAAAGGQSGPSQRRPGVTEGRLAVINPP